MAVSTEEFLTPDEVARLLKVPKATIYRWVHHRKIPFLKVGKHLRFRRGEILEWLEIGREGRNERG